MWVANTHDSKSPGQEDLKKKKCIHLIWGTQCLYHSVIFVSVPITTIFFQRDTDVLPFFSTCSNESETFKSKGN